MRRRTTIAILGTLLLFVLPALAQQPIPGNYAPGAFTGMKGVLQAPAKTFVLENGTMVWSIPGSNVLANRTIFGYVTDLKILGGDYFPAVIFPFANAPTRQQPGSRKEFQFSDLILQPIALGWHDGEWHTQISYNLWLPTGRFNAGASNNTGKGLYSHMIAGGVTWLKDMEKPWAATIMARYEFLTEQKDTGIKPGQVMTLEGGVGKEIFNGVDLGLTGYASFQTTEEQGSAAGTESTRYRTLSLGPEFNWRPAPLPGFQVAVRSYFEFGTRNVAEGIFTVFSVAYMF